MSAIEVRPLVGVNESSQEDRYVVQFVSEGAGRFVVDFKEYEIGQGGICFVSPSQLRLWEPEGEIVGFVLAFDEKYLRWPGSPFDTVFDLEFFHTVSRSPVLPAKAKAGAFLDLLEKMYGETQAGESRDEIVLRSYFKMFMTHLQQMYSDALDTSSATREPELVRRFKALVSRTCNAGVPLSDYADKLGVKPARLKSAVKLSSGRAPDQIVRKEVVTAAKRMLAQSDMSEAEIASLLGVESPSELERIFTETARVTPTDFRKLIREQYPYVTG